MLNSLVMLGNFFAADDFSRRHFQMHFFLVALWVNKGVFVLKDAQVKGPETGMLKVGLKATVVFFRSTFI